MSFLTDLFSASAEPVIEGIDQAREVVNERKTKKTTRAAKVNDVISSANDKDELLSNLVTVSESWAKEDKTDAAKKKLAKALNL